MAIVKCTQLKGLADKSDYTCKLSCVLHHALANLTRWNGRPRHVDQVCQCLALCQAILTGQYRIERRHRRLLYPNPPAHSRTHPRQTLPRLLQQQFKSLQEQQTPAVIVPRPQPPVRSSAQARANHHECGESGEYSPRGGSAQ